MTYKGKHINKPTLQMFIEYIQKMKMDISPKEVYEKFKSRNFKNANGKPVKRLEDVIAGFNSIKKYKIKKEVKHRDKHKFIPYDKQLQDNRWKEFREKILDIRGRKCEMCGGVHNLQVHHRKYINGLYAWEYSQDELIVLCRNCHKAEHLIVE